jgi:hypothetical protein
MMVLELINRIKNHGPDQLSTLKAVTDLTIEPKLYHSPLRLML